MRVFRTFRALVAAIESIAAHLHELLEQRDEAGTLADRIDQLERTRAMWEAEIEAGALKAESTLKAANNAEARERSLLKSNERLYGARFEDGDEGEVDGRADVPEGDVGPGEGEGVLPLHQAVEVDPRQAVVRAKYH